MMTQAPLHRPECSPPLKGLKARSLCLHGAATGA